MKKKIFIFLIAAVCAILIYGIYYLRTPVNSQKAERISESVTIDVDAVFVREEDVYYAPSAGYVYYTYTNGERAKNGALMASVYEGTPSENQLKALSVIDRKLKTSMYDGSNTIEVNSDPEAAESRIDEYRRSLIDVSKDNDISEAGKYKAMINAVRAQEETVEYIETEESLREQRTAVESNIGLVKHDIYSEHSGVFTTILDGLEKVLTPEKIEEITIEELESVYNIQGKSTENNVRDDQVMFKIVNNHEFYVLVVVNNSVISDYKVGKRVNLTFENIPGETTEGKIINIKKDEEKPDKSIMFIQCQKYLEGAYSFRESKGQVIFDTYEGYRVPAYAVRIDGDQKGVMAKKGNKTAFYPVRVLYTDTEEGYCIVDSARDAERKLDDADYIVIGER